MNHRRNFLAASAAAGAALASRSVLAQSGAWPTKPVRLVVPFPAGTAPDIMGRSLGEQLGRIWKQPVVIENKAGAGGIIGMTGVKIAPRDDHTFVLAPASAYTTSPYMFGTSQVDIVKDFVAVARLATGPMMLAVSASSSINSMADLVAAARSKDLLIATTSQFTLPHLSVDLIQRAAGVPMRAIPFNSSTETVQSVVNGDTQAVIDGIPPLDAMIKAGRLKPIAIAGDQRMARYPQVPTLAEGLGVKSLTVLGWFGVVAPVGTSELAIDQCSRGLLGALAAPEIVTRLETFGLQPDHLPPAKFAEYWHAERMRWEKVLKDIGAKPFQS